MRVHAHYDFWTQVLALHDDDGNLVAASKTEAELLFPDADYDAQMALATQEWMKMFGDTVH